MSSDTNRSGEKTEPLGVDSEATSFDPDSSGDSRPIPQVIGRYEVQRKIGRGGFGVVYLARDPQLDRPVAIKVPHAHLVRDAADAVLYLNEARTVAALDHPHIVTVHDIGQSAEFPYFIVSRYIAGETLSKTIRRRRLTPSETVQLTSTLADALHYAHSRNIVHRDIKPGNILIDRDGRPHLVDFGLALREQHPELRHRGFVGTPAYSSPEQARGEGHRVDFRSDIYSLGAVFYQLLTGQMTFSGGNTYEVLDHIMNSVPTPPRELVPTLPEELERICLRMLANRATERYPDANELRDDLEAYLVRCPSDGELSPRMEFSTPFPGAIENPSSTIPDDRQLSPKGLRPYSESDAEIFLSLLPGIRGRDGLPESLRFWKSRIEATSAEHGFPLGVLYGPSGAGKSSFVRAGLLPRLSDQVRPVYVEATHSGTEEALLRNLRAGCGKLPPDLNLCDSIAELRRNPAVAHCNKILLIVDQFEQWLHGRNSSATSSLIQALRQCDGVRVQCLILVRDDFWMALTRFMQQIELPLIEGRNTAPVDLFPIEHAERVLSDLGRAYGDLPLRRPDWNDDQRAFLTEAVAGLAQDGKVICVRITLLAEMMRGREWSLSTLNLVGGVDGLGVRYLEDLFGGSHAAPEHREHQHAARKVLAALLPDEETAIRGETKSERELLGVSGYEDEPTRFRRLIELLDRDLRLITLVDVERDASDEEHRDDTWLHRYQLTHDFLVSPLREWLHFRNNQSMRGRARIRLADRARFWSIQPEARHLPSLRETVTIGLLTKRADWTATERRMMRKALVHRGLRAVIGCLGFVALFIGVQQVRSQVRMEQTREALLSGRLEDVPALLPRVVSFGNPFRDDLRDRLERATEEGDTTAQLRLHLALDRFEPGHAVPLLQPLANGSVEDVSAIREGIVDRTGTLTARSWNAILEEEADPVQCLRLCSFLATTPDDDRWTEVDFGPVLLQLLNEDPFDLAHWSRMLQPLSQHLLPVTAELILSETEPVRWRRLVQLHGRFGSDRSLANRHLNQFALGETKVREEPLTLRQRARAAAALVLLGDRDVPERLLISGPDPTLRSLIIEQFGGEHLPLEVLQRALAASRTKSPDIRAAYLLAIGELGGQSRWPRSQRTAVIRSLTPNLTADDPGLRGAALWAFRMWTGHLPPADTPMLPRMMTLDPGNPSDARNATANTAVEHAFAMAIHEVTIEEFLRFRESHDYDNRAAPFSDCPVHEVTYFDAAAYCNWLSEQAGIPREEWVFAPNEQGEYADGMTIKSHPTKRLGYRLPTLAEWEYACRGPSTTEWSFGHLEELFPRYGRAMPTSGVHSWPVGTLRPNAFGLFDLHGNVWEWCLDPVNDRGEPIQGFGDHEWIVQEHLPYPLRGGTYASDARSATTITNNRNPARHNTTADGFRVVRSLRRSPMNSD